MPQPAAEGPRPEQAVNDQPPKTKHVVSVSIGSSKRDMSSEIELLGQPVRIERRGTDGDLSTAAELIRELDGRVDAIGLGGLDLMLVAAGRRYYLRDALRLARQAKTTPVVCGAGLKDSLERMAVEELDELLEWRDRRVLMVSGVDRFGMAEAIAGQGASVRYGDLVFALGIPVVVRDIRQLAAIARVLLPVISKLPVSWIYPTGKRQEEVKADSRARHFDWAEVIAGDFHFIRRYAPGRLDGKTILTNTTTSEDVAEMRRRGISRLITTTPRYDGRSLPTNLLEAALIAAVGRYPLSNEQYRELIRQAGLGPQIEE